MKVKYRKILRDYLIGWFIANLIYELLWNQNPGNRSTLDPIQRIIVFFLTWLGYGTFYGLLHIFIDRYINRRVPFLRLLISSLTLQLVVAVIFLTLVYFTLKIMEIDQLPPTLMGFFSLPVIPIALIYALIANFAIALFLQINMMLGNGNLFRIIRGKFYTPKVDKRIFMFLDLRGSTTIAEKLGHLKYSQLIQDCFYDLSIVHKYKADIYQYVGDEAVLEWRAGNGKESMNCIKTFFAFQDQIAGRAEFYRGKYEHLPEFKAGMNIGDVTIAEVGEMKREIAFHGDAINTAARIQGECNRLNSDLLVSEELLNYVTLEPWVKSDLKGRIHLKGKEEAIGIYSIEKIDPGMINKD